MTQHARPITLETARRLAVAKQRLSEPLTEPDAARMLDILRSIRCLQLDPISAVARSHTLVLSSRLGSYALETLDQLLWTDRALFEYWAHAASIVLTEDYPLHLPMMRGHASGNDSFSLRVKDWMTQNQALMDLVLSELRERGPLLSREIEADGIHPEAWVSTGWTNGRNLSRMIDHLWIRGDICVVGRRGGQKLWDLSERWLPEIKQAELLPVEVTTERAAEHAVRALGVARDAHIRYHYTRYRYQDLPAALNRMLNDGRLTRVELRGPQGVIKGTWVVHTDDLPLIERLEQGEYYPRTVLLSPFDNLICDRKRTQLLFDFDYTIEIYVPADKRKFGYYVLPVLHGDRLVGRIDSHYDRKSRQFVVDSVFAESDAPADAGPGLRAALESLGGFLGAQGMEVGRVPDVWRSALA